ncbi:MAG TPA: protein kinase, partial [Planctomycetota bacterium]|nr:protein kinase [Planctomycetota bacterium]
LVARKALTDERAAALLTELRLRSTGEVIAGYHILGRLGAGGMGTVYKAKQMAMDRVVALKVFATPEHEERDEGERFVREARAVARLVHPNIVRGFDAGEHSGVRWIAMELLEGATTHQLLKEIGPFPERRALEVVRSVALALDHAWRHGVVHRDIKPSNIFHCTNEKRIVLVDFGLAKRVVDDPFSSNRVTALGTPHYASPEQIRRVPDLDVRADLYSLGCTWYHLLTGRPPFTGNSSAEITAKHLTAPFPDPSAVKGRSETVRAAGVIMLRLCAKKREDRYPDPGALLQDLDALGQALGRHSGTSTSRLARSIVDRLMRAPAPAPAPPPAYGGVEDLLKQLEELQEENARLFCDRDLLRHEAAQDEKNLEALEAENARLACGRDLLAIEVEGLRRAMDGLRLRREAQRRARASREPAPEAGGGGDA